MMKSETEQPAPDLPGTNNHVQMVLAKALFDNIAETPDELAFRRGDIITIVNQNPLGLEGWSLCMFRGKQGIAPANRLKIIAAANVPDGVDLASEEPVNNVKWNRRSWHLCPDKVMTPEKLGEIYVYQQPDHEIQDYDIPPSRYFPADVSHIGKMVNKSQSFDSADTALKLPPTGSLSQHDIYDVPPGGRVEIYDVPPSASTRVSTGSTVSSSLSIPNFQQGGMVSGPSSSCGSARSSIDIPAQDIYDIPPSQSQRAWCRSPMRSPLRSPINLSETETYDTPPSKFGPTLDIYDTPPSKVQNISQDSDYATPLKADVTCDGDEVYDIPRSKLFPRSELFPAVDSKNDRDKRGMSSDSGFDASQKGSEVYDVPPSSLEHVIDELYDVPPSNMQKVQGKKCGHLRHKSNELLDVASVYDIPPQVTRDSAISMRSESSSVLDDLSSRLSSCSMDSRGSSELPAIPYEELRLDLDSAMELLVKLQQEVQSSTSKLLSFVSSSWRTKENLQPQLYNIQTCCKRFSACLKEFVEFGQGAIANSATAEDKKLVKKLIKQMQPLQMALQTVTKRMHHIDVMGWQIDKLTEPVTSSDDLGRIVEIVTEVPNEVRSVASLLQGNSTLLFKRAQKLDGSLDEPPLSSSTPVKSGPPTLPKPVRKSLSRKESAIQDRPLPAPPVKNTSLFDNDFDVVDDGKPRIYEEPKKPDGSEYEKEIVDDYDYVHLQNRPSTLKRNKHLRTESESERDSSTLTGLSAQFSERLAQAQRNTVPVERRPSRRQSTLQDSDRQLLGYYAHQIELLAHSLVNTIDTFFQCIEYNQPPKIFVAHSKFVIVGAHKMVYIGDTLHRNVMCEDVRIKIMACANYLCDCLKAAVISTKHAALQYPSVPAVQTMVDRVVDVSHASNELKLVIIQASKL